MNIGGKLGAIGCVVSGVLGVLSSLDGEVWAFTHGVQGLILVACGIAYYRVFGS